MPEGDTIFRTATTLRRALLSKAIINAEATFTEVTVAGPFNG